MTSRETTMGAQGTLCWKCEWAAGKDHKCPWATKFEPVPGWNATPTTMVINEVNYKKTIHSFLVHECPLFKLMTEIKRAQEEKAAKVEELKSVIQGKDNKLEVVEQLWLEEHKTADEIAEVTGLPYYKVEYLKRKIKELMNDGK